MIEKEISVDLPSPWSGGTFDADRVGPINYLVGPNGSGKSRFAERLLRHFEDQSFKAKLLGTDRLREMANPGQIGRSNGDHFAAGYPKSSFEHLRQAGGGKDRASIPFCCLKTDWTSASAVKRR